MSIQATIKFDKAALNKKMLLIGQTVEDKVKDRLIDMAQFVVKQSPVDTGAYVTSHSVKTNRSRGRGKTSHGKPRSANPQEKRQEGLQNMIDDINKIDILNTTKIVFRNDSPHAQAVEHGGNNWKVPGYKVYTQLRNVYG
jgi:hypothetical protein